MKSTKKTQVIKAYGLALNIKGTLYLDVREIFLSKKQAKIEDKSLIKYGYEIIPVVISF